MEIGSSLTVSVNDCRILVTGIAPMPSVLTSWTLLSTIDQIAVDCYHDPAGGVRGGSSHANQDFASLVGDAIDPHFHREGGDQECRDAIDEAFLRRERNMQSSVGGDGVIHHHSFHTSPGGMQPLKADGLDDQAFPGGNIEGNPGKRALFCADGADIRRI